MKCENEGLRSPNKELAISKWFLRLSRKIKDFGRSTSALCVPERLASRDVAIGSVSTKFGGRDGLGSVCGGNACPGARRPHLRYEVLVEDGVQAKPSSFLLLSARVPLTASAGLV